MIGKEETCVNCAYSEYDAKERKRICCFHWTTVKGPDGEFIHACIHHIPAEEEPY